MKIEKITIENFRGFSGKTIIDFGQLNVFIGKNDAGKSTVLEALDVFFNDGKKDKGVIKIDDQDKNNDCQDNDNVSIKVSFSNYPERVDIDSGNTTSLKEEYLLNNELLEIEKRYKGKKSSAFIVANHPTCELCKDLLLLKNIELKKIVKDNNLECANQSKNAELRKSIRDHCSNNLEVKETAIPTDKNDAKAFLDKIENLLPSYSLFQSDRKNEEGDSEAQDPIKEAVKHVLKNGDLETKLDDIAKKVKEEITKVLDKTLEKLGNINPEIARTLNAKIPETKALKWEDVFKGIGIYGDGDIPLNKRGSGVKRLVLLSFFMAEAERKQEVKNNIIYAMEEPETAQHPEHQKILIKTFEDLSKNCQVLLTTHSPIIVQLLTKENHSSNPTTKENNNINLITKENGAISIQTGKELLSQSDLALKYVSGNEISYLAFDYVSAEFHTELYSFIGSNHNPVFKEKIMNQNKNMPTMSYIQQKPDGTKEGERNITLQEYIRHQIHHPENERNDKYSQDQLRKSIEEMREWLLASE